MVRAISSAVPRLEPNSTSSGVPWLATFAAFAARRAVRVARPSRPDTSALRVRPAARFDLDA